MNKSIFETAVTVVTNKEKTAPLKVIRANNGGYIPTDETDMDEMIGAIIDNKYKLPIDQYSFWLPEGDAADFKSFGIKSKTYTDRRGQKRFTHDGPISIASFKKVLAACDVNVELVKRPFPQPKIVARIPGKARATVKSDNRIGR